MVQSKELMGQMKALEDQHRYYQHARFYCKVKNFVGHRLALENNIHSKYCHFACETNAELLEAMRGSNGCASRAHRHREAMYTIILVSEIAA